MKKVSQTRQFSRDVKRIHKRGKDVRKLQEVVRILVEGLIPFLNQSALFVGSVVSLLDVLAVRLRRLLLAASISSLI